MGEQYGRTGSAGSATQVHFVAPAEGPGDESRVGLFGVCLHAVPPSDDRGPIGVSADRAVVRGGLRQAVAPALPARVMRSAETRKKTPPRKA
ncbi:hypothetical protein GCM10010361_14020 [Streptomyces olivaceiscleroticus]|uniref:Uncharacterized protein n=1 Tax=Streptomyces olivaceiscleroticus TaxID=68245 RepID=A0ABN0ZL10_9ACTN